MAEEVLETSPPAESTWSQIWQLPALLLGVLLLSVWVYTTLTGSAKPLRFQDNLNTTQQYLEAGKFDEAKAELDKMAQYIDRAAQLDVARMHQLTGDLMYLSQRAKGSSLEADHKTVDEAYGKATELGLVFDPQHTKWWASTLVSLGKDTEALEKVDSLPADPASERYGLIRELVLARRKRIGVDPSSVMPLLDRFVSEVRDNEHDRVKRRAEDIWAIDQQAQLMLDVGNANGVIDLLHLRLMKLTADGGDKDLGPLMLRMAQAYQRTANYEQASHFYQQSRRRLLLDDALNAEVLVGLAQIDQVETGDFRQALEKFSEAEMRFTPESTPAYFDAIVGRAYSEAHLGAHGESIEHFGRAVEFFLNLPHRSADKEDQLVSAIRAHFELSRDREDDKLSLDYLSLLPPLYKVEKEWPLRLLHDFATTHERVANDLMEQAHVLGGDATGHAPINPDEQTPPDADRALMFKSASLHYEKAADFYRRHAREIAPVDEKTHGQSLWRSAECFDRAQRWSDAIDVYAEFRKTRPNDPKHVAAILRLGMAHKADGQWEAAIQRFTELTTDFPNAPEAYEALVPMAQCQMALGNFSDAKRVLLHVVTNHPAITFDSQPYRDAVIALGKLHYRIDEFGEAIERLTEAVTRYNDSPDIASLRFRLADAYRRSVDRLDEVIADPVMQSRRSANLQARADRLDKALMYYSQTITELELRKDEQLSKLEQLYLRNAYFYRADCAYDLGRFEQSIELYDLAAKRWEKHPSALVALVQIVNAHCELGQFQEASVANLRARELLKRIPDEAFSDPLLPMTRQHWQTWQRWSEELDSIQAQANAGS